MLALDGATRNEMTWVCGCRKTDQSSWVLIAQSLHTGTGKKLWHDVWSLLCPRVTSSNVACVRVFHM